MRAIFLATVLTLLTLLSLTTTASEIEDAHAGLIDGYTPAEIQRNAQRQALGMPPIPPRALRKKTPKPKKPGRFIQSGDETPAMVPLSTIPDQKSTGHIAIHEDSVTGPLLGYLNAHKMVPKVSEATEYTYTTTGSLMEIMVSNSKQRMCVSAGLYGQALGLGKKNFHMARHTLASTIEGDIPLHDKRSSLYLETSIFSVNPSTGEIEVSWKNPDGSRPPVQIVLRDERIYYTGDLSSFREYLGDDDYIVPVVYKWTPTEELNA